MKHAALRAIGHNFVDCLTSGWSEAVGPPLGSQFVEAALVGGHPIKIDFLNGRILDGKGWEVLEACLAELRAILPEFCRQNDAHITNFRTLCAEFEPLHTGYRILLKVEGQDRRCSTTEYSGTPLRRVQMLDGLGRRRPKPVKAIKL